jgi:hypothetical protein
MGDCQKAANPRSMCLYATIPVSTLTSRVLALFPSNADGFARRGSAAAPARDCPLNIRTAISDRVSMTQKSKAKADASENDRKPRAAPKPRPLRDADARALEEFKARQQRKPPMEEISLRDLGFDKSGVAHAGNAFMSGDPTFTVGLCRQLQQSSRVSRPGKTSGPDEGNRPLAPRRSADCG